MRVYLALGGEAGLRARKLRFAKPVGQKRLKRLARSAGGLGLFRLFLKEVH
jgi:hypothetical protein